MQEIRDLVAGLRSRWKDRRPATHRGEPVPFKLRCAFGVSSGGWLDMPPGLSLRVDYDCFQRACGEALLFFDDACRQWGLRTLDGARVLERTEGYFSSRSADARREDLVIGEFFGDCGLLLLRCDLGAVDFAAVVVANAIDRRVEWCVAAPDFASFLSRDALGEGDRYWAMSGVG